VWSKKEKEKEVSRDRWKKQEKLKPKRHFWDRISSELQRLDQTVGEIFECVMGVSFRRRGHSDSLQIHMPRSAQSRSDPALVNTLGRLRCYVSRSIVLGFSLSSLSSKAQKNVSFVVGDQFLTFPSLSADSNNIRLFFAKPSCLSCCAIH